MSRQVLAIRETIRELFDRCLGGVPGNTGPFAGVAGDRSGFADIASDGGRFADITGDGRRFGGVGPPQRRPLPE
jgi:hypothetical protein